MALLRNKIYKIVGNNTYYVPLARGLQSTAIGSGVDDGQLMRAIPYAADITTQGILDFLIDLVENDNAINNEINGINRIIAEGVLQSLGYQFDYTFRYASEADGTVVMSSGHDWSSINQTFTITIRSAGTNGTPTTITLNANCATAQAVIDEINAELATANLDDYVEARLDSYNRVYFRGLVETDPAVVNTPNYNGFILAAGSPDALATLGITAGTYTGNLKENTVTGGAAKLHESNSVYSVYEVADSSVFDSPTVNTTNWYRRDLINIVFKDTNNPDLVPYLEYIEGEESDTIPVKHTLLAKTLTTTKNTYPLWSVLFKNDAGTFKYVEHDQVFAFGGLKETVWLSHTQAFQKANTGFYASLHKNIQFTDATGTPLPLAAGTSSTQYELAKFFYDMEDVCADDPTGKISLQEPDVQFRDDLAHGDLLTIPFKLSELLDDYAAATTVELHKFELAINASQTTTIEGLELHIYTAKYFVNAYNFGQVGIVSVTPGLTYTTLELDMDIYTFTQLTANNKTFESPSPFVYPQAGDFIFVFSGEGQYQVSAISSIVDETHIVIHTLPITLDATSKILIFKEDTIALAGEDITGTFLAEQTYDDQIRYAEQYPYSVHTGISSLPMQDASRGYQEFGLTGIEGTADTGLYAATYYFKIAIDGGAATEYYFITVATPYTYNQLVTALNGALATIGGAPISGVTFEIVGGDIRCTSDTTGISSKIALTAGTTGYNLFGSATHYGLDTTPDTAVDGQDLSPNTAKIYGTADLEDGHDWSSTNQSFVLTAYYEGSTYGPATITLNANCTTIDEIITHINTRIAVASPDLSTYIVAYKYIGNTVAFKTTSAGTQYGLAIAAGAPSALTTFGITAGTAYGTTLDLDDFFNTTNYPLNQRLFNMMPDPPGTFAGYPVIHFPFKLSLNYNQWYFARVSIKDRSVPYSEYGERPELVVLNTTWAASNAASLSTFSRATIITNAGLYPYIVDGQQIFKIEDEYGDITVDSAARAVKGYPTKYILVSRNLGGTAFATPTDDDNVYVDVLNGIVAFKTGSGQAPEDIWLSYYYNSILTGAIWTDQVHHEKLNGEVWNLQMLIEQLINPATATMTGSTTSIINIAPYRLTSGGGIGDYDFQPGTVVRYDTQINPQFGWCKAVASNFHYVGDAMVIERISDTEFKIISLGYINNIGTLTDIYTPNITDDEGNNLVKNTIYYLSDKVAGGLTRIKPSIAQPILFTFTDNGGYGVVEGLVVLSTKTSFFSLYDVNQTLTQRCNDLSNQADELTKQVMELMTTVSFQGGRVSQTSNYVLDTFNSLENTSARSIQTLTKPGDIMDDGSANLNWKEGIESSLLAYKQGFWRPRQQYCMGENIMKYDLTGLGLTIKKAIDYDSVNQCYWMMTYAHATSTNQVGAIVKLTLDGRTVHFAGIWHLPAAGTSRMWNGVCSDGANLYITASNIASTGGVSSVLYKIPINSNGTIGETTQYASGDLLTLVDAYSLTISSTTGYSWDDVVLWEQDGYEYVGILEGQNAAKSTLIIRFMLRETLVAGGTLTSFNDMGKFVGLGAGTSANLSLGRKDKYLFLRVYTTT